MYFYTITREFLDLFFLRACDLPKIIMNTLISRNDSNLIET